MTRSSSLRTIGRNGEVKNGRASKQELLALLRPYPDGALKTWPVDEMVGNVSEIRICNSARHFPLGSRDNL